MKLYLIILLVLLSVPLWLKSTTWEIKQDGTGNFITIQEGIDASTDADTVLVYPGTYYENIIYNGKNIMVASLELTTGNATYIDSTIINGQRLDSCVLVIDQETDANIQGFTITNGQGHQDQYWYSRGGGILIYDHSAFNITDCIIKRNYAVSGGGIYLSYYSNINISGTSIINNYASTTAGGFMVDDNSQCIFDATNRCNIYNNFAASGIDIYLSCCEYLDVIVDTFSILNPTRYFANHVVGYLYPNTYTFDILNYSLEQVNQDLYVSPDGDDSNSGLSPDEPMKTINLAIRKVISDSLEPKTIYIESGIYAEGLNNQFFAIGGKSFIKIIGEDAETTIIDGELNSHPLLWIGPGANKCFIKNLTFQNNTYHHHLYTLFFSNRDEVYLENLIIQNNIGTDHGTVLLNNLSKVELINIEILNNSSIDGVTGLHLPDCDSISVIDCVIKNNHASGGICSGMQATSTGDITIENTVFSGNTINTNNAWTNASALCIGSFNYTNGKFSINNCLFENNQCIGTTENTNFIASNEDQINITNCTIIDNESNYSFRLKGDIFFNNNILRNNCNYEIIMEDLSLYGFISELDISHCNVQGGQNALYNQNNANIINWLEGNIDEDPMFIGTLEYPYQLSPFSPCIDAGTPDTTGLFIPPWDLLNNHRVWDGDNNGTAIIDMGCYEFGAEPYVSSGEEIIELNKINLHNYPNPFNPETTIKFNLKEDSKVTLEIYNIKGQKVKTLVNDVKNAGYHSVIWDGKDDKGKNVTSGIFLYRMKADKYTSTRKMILLK